MDKTPKLLSDYIKVYENVFSADFCNQVISRLEDDWQKHTFYSHAEKEKFNYDTDLDISHQETNSTRFIGENLFHVLKNYIDDVNLPSLQGWDGYTNIRFNRYKENKEMHWHADRVQEMFDGQRKGIPTLSIVGLLNDNYKGGEFVMFDDHIVDLPQGSVMIFPSTFMYIHKVNPVTEGIRYSYVSWVW